MRRSETGNINSEVKLPNSSHTARFLDPETTRFEEELG
jgi:hypothetical protein